MIQLALRSVLHAWRRYLPVAVAVGVSGLMMVAQLGLVMGAVSLAAVPVRQSTAALWVGPEAAASLDQAAELSAFAVGPLYLDPRVTRIEAYQPPDSVMMGTDEHAESYVQIMPIDPAPGSMLLARALPDPVRARLAEPGTVAMDRADAIRLGLKEGGRVTLARQSLRIVAVVEGIRGLMGTQFVTSPATARSLSSGGGGARPTYYLLGVAPGTDLEVIANDLESASRAKEYRVWQAEALAQSTVRDWAMSSGAGTLFLASSAIALTITLMVVSQTLGAAVAGSVREYAALRAYGISFRRVQGLVMAQGAWVSAAALVLTAAASVALLMGLKSRRVAVEMTPTLAAVVTAGLLVTVIVSNLLAVRRLRHADPAALLR